MSKYPGAGKTRRENSKSSKSIIMLVATPANKRLQLTAFGARDRWHFNVILYCAPSAATEAQGVGWPASIVGGVHVWLFRRCAISPPPRPPRAAPPIPIPHYPAPRFPATILARLHARRSCHQNIPSVVRAAQPATQADAAARPKHAGHFAR